MIARGSEWCRWEPHIHTPGTVFNDQFGGGDRWDIYLTTLETSVPKIGAMAITDYYLTDTYQEVLRHKTSGRLADVKLLFPNIEVRLDVAARSGFVNLHLLVSPEDPDHIQQVHRILTRLNFKAFGDTFACSREDLIRLGKKADATILDDRSALVHGAQQFKVNFTELKDVYKNSDWAKENILIAVSGNSGDGTSGVRQAADATLRQEIEKFAHIIFSSYPSQREFWLGKRGTSIEQLRERYDGCKPCLHGCDAHDQASTGRPTDDRFSWLKGSLTFDALRQACIDPEGRVFVGSEPPRTAMPSQVISQIDIENAAWASTNSIPLNPGLVAIIGARGSGKTALADMIAAGSDAIPVGVWTAEEDVSPSFLVRARPNIGNGQVKLKWGGGTEAVRRLDGSDADLTLSYHKARYLSQQFVEELCSSRGASDGLIREIERVIFEAHPHDQDGAINFAELRDHRTQRFQLTRQLEVDSIAATSERIAVELEKEALVGMLTNQIAQKEDLIKGYNADLSKLVVTGTEAQARRYAALNEATQQCNSKVTGLGNQRRTFITMQDEVNNTRTAKAPEMLREAQARHAGSGLNTDQWNAFLLIYSGNVDEALTGYIAWADKEILQINGITPIEGDPNTPLIPENADLKNIQLATLKAEMARLEKFISADTMIRSQYTALSRRITTENGALQALKLRLSDATGAADRRKTLQKEREDAYGRLFDALISEQQALADLYAPLMQRLKTESGTLNRLSFTVKRVVAASSWATIAEEKLIDCRKTGDFYGRGSLAKVANAVLKPVWETGSASEVRSAMEGFISSYSKSLLTHAPFVPKEQTEFRAWSKQFAHWLFSTEHISVRYEIAYDGVDIRKLSPGTRGIVLLLLYLALDDADDRPLIIDQPEENLDPKSVFDELVSLFIAAKSKRQVIIVTHNANLVINTDADQIIVANAVPNIDGGLPTITYKAGGLEDADIRKTVSDILEGGSKAFQERARRLRVRLER